MTNDSLTDSIIDAIADKGWSVSLNLFDPKFLDELINEEKKLWEEGEFRKAGVGTGADKKVRPEIRSDHVLWLDESELTDLQRQYWNRIDELKTALNRSLYLGLNDYEAHFAVYPPGSFYTKHLDQFAKVRERTISCILYLNKDWGIDDGGQLRIYHSENEADGFLDVQPHFGTFVCFRSDTVYHEVLPANRDRFSLTGWLKRV